MKLSEIDIGPKMIMLYGEPGCGKTALALTLGDKALYADFDRGLSTGINLKDKFTAQRGEVEVVTFYDDQPNMVDNFSRFKQFVIKLCGECAKGNVPQKVLVIDSLTAMIDSALFNIMSNSNRLGQNPVIAEYGMLQTDITNVFRMLKVAKIHVVCLAHVFVYQEGGLGKPEITKRKIYIQGSKLEPKLTPYFDEIWYMDVDQGTRKIRTVNTGTLLARTRSPLEKEIETDDIPMLGLFKLIGEEL